MMTSRFAICAVAVGAIGLAAGLQSSAQAADAPTTTFATIATAISIAKVDDMQFGTIAEDGTGGTIRLATDDSRSIVAGGVSLLSSGPGTAAEFTVTGEDSATYTITLPTAVLLSGPGVDMTANNFVTLPTPTGTLSAAPCPCTETLFIGGDLIVGVAQATGAYSSAPFNVTVDYN